MMRHYRIYLCAAGTLASLLLCGCEKPASPTVSPPPVATPPAQAPVATQTSPPTTPTAPVKSATSETAVQEAVQKTLTQKQNRAIFPAGVHLLHVTIQGRVVTLDMSAEFNALANMGDTTESEAQKALRATLQAFPDIEKMRVTVKGKAFDSQVTDWNTPFSVRATEGETHSGETTANKQTSTQDLHTP